MRGFSPHWTARDEALYRRETERRFRARTPCPSGRPDLADPGFRVTRTEMRNWSLDVLGTLTPVEEGLLGRRAEGYRRMARRVLREVPR